MIVRCAVALAFAGLALVPFAHADAQRLHGGGGAAMLLRYRFVPGQTLTYQIKATVQFTLAGGNGASSGATLPFSQLFNSTAGINPLYRLRMPSRRGIAIRLKASVNGTIALGGVVSESVLSVDAHGGATVRVKVSNLTLSATVGGLTRSQTLPASTVPAQTVHINPDGSEQASGPAGSGISVQSAGVLPPNPVAPGAQWGTQINTTVPAGSGLGPIPIHGSLQTTFTGYGQAAGQIVAILDSMTAVNYKVDEPIHMAVKATSSDHTLFGLESGQIVSSQVQADLSLTLQTPKLQPSTSGSGTTLPASLTLSAHVIASVQRIS